MYIREYQGYGDSDHDLLSNSNIYPECQPPDAHCPPQPSRVAAPQHASAIVPSPPHPAPTSGGGAKPAAAEAFTDNITRFGQRNFIGLIVLGVLVFVGLVLWMTFGMWPKKALTRVRERLARRKEGRNRGGGGSGGMAPRSGSVTRTQETELGREKSSEFEAECNEKPPIQDDGSGVEGRRPASTDSAASSSSLSSEGDEKLGEKGTEKEADPTETAPRVRFA